MSDSEIVSRFCKSREWHHLSRRFHNLDRDAKEIAIGLIREGREPAKAIDKARRAAK